MKKILIILLAILLSLNFALAINLSENFVEGWEKGDTNGIKGTTTTAVNVATAQGYDGTSDYSLEFDGSTSVIYANDDDKWKLTNFTIIAVVKPRSMSSGGIGILDYFTNKNIFAPPQYYGYALRLRFGAVLGFHDYIMDGDSSYNVLVSNTLLDFNEWHMIAMTYDISTNNHSIFYNGSMEGTAITDNPISFNVTDKLSIGNTYETDYKTADPLDGFIDRLYIINRTLSQAEIAEIYNGGDILYTEDFGVTATTDPSAPIIYYDFDDEHLSGIIYDNLMSSIQDGRLLNGTAVSGFWNESIQVTGDYTSDLHNFETGATPSLFTSSSEWTLSMLLNINTITSDLNGVFGCLDGSNVGFGTRIDNADDKLYVFDGAAYYDLNFTITEDVWYLTTFVYENLGGGNTRFRVYVNGTKTYDEDLDLICSSFPNMTIGNIYYSASSYGGEGMVGLFDEFIFYDFPLNDSQIQGLLERYQPVICTPNWSCDGYAACVLNLSSCNSVIDLQACGESYTGDYSEFPDQPCNISAGYNPVYVTGDLTPIIADGLGTAGATIVGFTALIIIGAIGVAGYKQFKKLRR